METTSTGGGIGRPLGIFLLWMILGQGLLAGIGFAFPDFEVPGSFGLVVTVLAVLMAGQGFAKAHQREMTRSEQVRFGLAATAIALGLSAGFILGLFLYYGVPMTTENLSLALTGDANLARDLGGWLWVILGAGVLITYAITRYGVGSGAKGWLKKQAKLAARG